jgi:hypothetical protein
MNAEPDSTTTKTCPMCAETIKTAAKKCPFCQVGQGRWKFWGPELFPLVGAFVVAGVAVALLTLAFPEDAVSEGRDFARYRQELDVLHATVERANPQPDFWVSGFVTNQGTHSWRIRELEVRLLDAHGNLGDVQHPRFKETFVVEPAHEHAFRTRLGNLAWTNFTAVPQVRVQIATDGHRSAGPE